MKRLLFAAIFLMFALPAFAQGPEVFVGNWKSDPGTPTMSRQLTYQNHEIVMVELQPGRNGGPQMTIYREYPTDGNTVTMHKGIWDGATATGKMEGGVLTVDTTMKNGTKFRDVWTPAADGKSYVDDMTINRPGSPTRTVKFSYTKQD